ncbi:hypothetical protein cypCar_00019103 [Cyprinus carpio]|nr:hypothetical protein cypCar_00019103 [Cyprinus carpio]
MFRPMVSDPIYIHRKSPLPRSKKIGSVEVLSENNSHSRPSRLHPDHKLTPGIGSHCAGLFSTMVLGGSSSAPNLQDYAHAHRKKLTSSGFLDGFELYSMVPSICPLETLHNSLSLRQVDDFLASIAISHDPVLEISASSPDQVDFPARKPRGISGKTSQPSSETKQPKPAPNISILLPPESHDPAVKTQRQSSDTATHETPALENKSATKTVSGFYT